MSHTIDCGRTAFTPMDEAARWTGLRLVRVALKLLASFRADGPQIGAPDLQVTMDARVAELSARLDRTHHCPELRD